MKGRSELIRSHAFMFRPIGRVWEQENPEMQQPFHRAAK